MAADDFFNRWSKRKNESKAVGDSASTSVENVEGIQPASPADKADTQLAKPLPTMEDVAGLTPDSDYSGFVASGVDESVKNSAMKKLFALPNFNVMDGLDIYIDDYSKPDPLPPGMLAGLLHAKALLDPLSQLEKPLMTLIGRLPVSQAEDGHVAEPDAIATASQNSDEHIADTINHDAEQAVSSDEGAAVVEPPALSKPAETHHVEQKQHNINPDESHCVPHDHSV